MANPNPKAFPECNKITNTVQIRQTDETRKNYSIYIYIYIYIYICNIMAGRNSGGEEPGGCGSANLGFGVENPFEFRHLSILFCYFHHLLHPNRRSSCRDGNPRTQILKLLRLLLLPWILHPSLVLLCNKNCNIRHGYDFRTSLLILMWPSWWEEIIYIQMGG